MTVDELVAPNLARVDLAQVDVRVADRTALPFEAPKPNAVTSWEGLDALWLGPDEWLVVGAASAEGEIVGRLEASLSGHHHSVLDVSANRTVFDLVDGLELLSSGCGLDLDPRHWRPGMCAQTLFGGAQVILHQRDERTTRLFVRPSFTGYVTDRLRSASA